MQQAILVDISYLRQLYNTHYFLSGYPTFFERWLIERLHCVFNVPLSFECINFNSEKPIVRDESSLDNNVWIVFNRINKLSAHITNNPLMDFKIMGNLLLLIF